uniref:ATP synthase subunit a n=1 Tax=Parapsyche difformis TaxID=2904886 RepID=A0A9E8RT08_9NEOP|nr:ATP synthase F0 subunit 6 [Parapsyche difformis]UZZ43679.1 ATP synthase F0 subunit 6 [Parapsyche difformis]
MTNLFSIFDPSSSILSLSINWLSSLLILLILPLSFWFIPSRLSLINLTILKLMNNEIYTLLKTKASLGLSLMFSSMFIMLALNNFMGLFPYVFTSTSHLTFNLTFSLPIWFSLMFFGWLNKTEAMFSHLIPQGTPPILMPFMVLIETISNLIRPLTLAVRLTANMIAGHLLITLLSSTGNYSILYFLIILLEIMLLSLESAVAMIQAYVFTILSTLYTSEI